IVAQLAAVGEDGVFHAHHQTVVRVVGVNGDSVSVFVWAMEEFGNVAQLGPGLWWGKIVAVFGLERLHFLRVLEPVLAIGPANGISLRRDRPVLSGVCRVLR